MNYETILVTQKEGVLTITLNRPEVLNSFIPTLNNEITTAVQKAGRDPQVRCLIITGQGKAFCAGEDLKSHDEKETISLGDTLRKRYVPMITAIRNIPKPVIAAVNGAAAGAGASLALAADMRVMGENSYLIEAFVNIGLVPDAGSHYFLVRLVGLARAFEICTLGEKVLAREALSLGLCNRVVPDDQLIPATEELAQRFVRGPAKTIGLIKTTLNKAVNGNLEEMLNEEAYAQEIAGRSAEFKEGVNAWRERRKAKFV